MTRDEILDNIRRLAKEHDNAPGQRRFEDLTGIRRTEWEGRYWARWSDALREAGCEPNQMQRRTPDVELLDHLILVVDEQGSFPTEAELRLRRREDPSFPSPEAFRRLGRKPERARRVMDRCDARGDLDHVKALCAPFVAREEAEAPAKEPQLTIGAVYLMKSGPHFKIGYSNSVGRRAYELGLVLPDQVETVHVIETDDPQGVEAYWHRRFADRRRRGEWFDLTRNDVRAFKRWKTIV